MTLSVTAGRGPLTTAAAVLAIPMRPRKSSIPKLGAGAELLVDLGLDATAALKAEQATGRAGEIVAIPVHRDRVDQVLLVGTGDDSSAALRKAAAAVARRSAGSKSLATTLAVGRDLDDVRAIAEAMGLATYKFSVKASAKPAALKRVKLIVDEPAAVRTALAQAAATVAAVCRARDLVNTPSLVKSPSWLAAQARELAESAGVSVTVREVDQLVAEGFAGIVAVGQGSARPPCLVELSWSPVGATQHVVLVGKGITFDSGGVSLKPPEAMIAMKTDMGGAAAVIATMSALAELGVRVRVTGLVPLAENMPSATAIRPGDVITHYDGRTDEILNTDAEGRIVLADALGYAVTRLDPDVVVDIATLTGAAPVGLGKRHGALYANTAVLAAALVDAAGVAGERLWPMPLETDYREALDSEIADLRNTANPAFDYNAGSIIAALFLQEFVGSVPWAHLDIAGPSRADSDEGEIAKGGTGFGVKTFLRWLEGMSAVHD